MNSMMDNLKRSMWQVVASCNLPYLFCVATIAIYLAVFIYMFVQNFVFSSDLNTLIVRDVDDLQFHFVMRNLHTQFEQNDFKNILLMNWFGYGWLYWFPLVVLTYPFYLLSTQCDHHMLLIILPRQISLVFTFATAFVVFKILSNYTKNTTTKCVAMLLLICYPTFAFATQRFGTVAQTMFFASLALYLTLKAERINYKSMTNIALAIAASAATKLIGLLIAPLIGLLILDRMEWSITLRNFKLILYTIFITAFCSVIFTFPGVFNAFYSPTICSDFYNTLIHYVSFTTKDNCPGPAPSIMTHIKHGFVANTLPMAVFMTLLFLPVVQIIDKYRVPQYSRHFMYYSSFLCFVMCFLGFSIQSGPYFSTIYFTTCSYILVLNTVIFEGMKPYIRNVIYIFMLCMSISWVLERPPEQKFQYNYFFMYRASPPIRNKLRKYHALMRHIGPLSKYPQGVNIMRDYTGPVSYTSLNANVTEFILYVGTSINEGFQILPSIDFFILAKNNPSLKSDIDFANIKTVMPEQLFKNVSYNRPILQNLLKTNMLNGVRFSKVLELDDVWLFKREGLQ